MFTKIILFCLIFSLVNLNDGVDGAVKNQKPWTLQRSCSSYFVKEMLHLFADEKIDKKIQQAITKLRREKGNKTAFTAQLAKEETYSNKEVFKFTKVITNVGGGLNATDGVFYCPEPGLYYFFVNIMTNTNGAYAEIHKNDKFVMYVHTDYSGTNWKSGSNAVILQLDRGDRISVKSHASVRLHQYAFQWIQDIHTLSLILTYSFDGIKLNRII